MRKRSVFDPAKFEQKWQNKWLEEGIYSPDMGRDENPFYNLWMFPYPSGEGLHAGHAFASTGSDVYGRYQRMRGNTVFQPIGYDSFGIHSENYAIKIGDNPMTMIPKLKDRYKQQLLRMGHGYDWSRTVTTSDIDYYRWTQWVFLKMHQAGLVERKSAKVNWCPSCLTVLADEQVINGECERCSSQVIQKDLEQWFFKMASGRRPNGKLYVESLLENLDKLDWSEVVLTSQRNWIGKKEGARVQFSISNSQFSRKSEVFTTRIDTIFGATYLVVAPEVAKIWMEQGWSANQESVEYIEEALKKTEQVRKIEEREKTGVLTNLTAINPANNKEIPVYVADYVLMDVGTGVVMGVPAHDERDMEFAVKYGGYWSGDQLASRQERSINNPAASADDSEKIAIIPVIRPTESNDLRAYDADKLTDFHAYTGEGELINSGKYDGMSSAEAREAILSDLTKGEKAEKMVHYHLRDWLISRQRYWGAPIPMIRCEKCGWQAVPDQDLPVELPPLENFKPTGKGVSPLGQLTDFVNTVCPSCGGEGKRETDVCDTFLDSSWYFLRYPSVGDDKEAFDLEITKKWLPVNRYIGGAEHANLHLLYARFVTMVLFDLGIIGFEEPFKSFRAHGLLIKDGHKMSKSKGNVISPDSLLNKFGADTLRCYLMFIGPLEKSADFRDAGIAGMYRWLNRVWDQFNDGSAFAPESTEKAKRMLSKVAKRVGEDIESLKYNTAIAALMEFMNLWRQDGQKLSLEDAVVFLKLLAPLAPYMTEELYQNIRYEKGETSFQSIHKSMWPDYDPALITEQVVNIAVQVNGKLRSSLVVDQEKAGNQQTVEELALGDYKARKWIGSGSYRVIFVPGRLINFVV